MLILASSVFVGRSALNTILRKEFEKKALLERMELVLSVAVLWPVLLWCPGAAGTGRAVRQRDPAGVRPPGQQSDTASQHSLLLSQALLPLSCLC